MAYSSGGPNWNASGPPDQSNLPSSSYPQYPQQPQVSNAQHGYAPHPQYSQAASLNQGAASFNQGQGLGQSWSHNVPPQYQHGISYQNQQQAYNRHRVPSPAQSYPLPALSRNHPPQAHQPSVNGYYQEPSAQVRPLPATTPPPIHSQAPQQARQVVANGHRMWPTAPTQFRPPDPGYVSSRTPQSQHSSFNERNGRTISQTTSPRPKPSPGQAPPTLPQSSMTSRPPQEHHNSVNKHIVQVTAQSSPLPAKLASLQSLPPSQSYKTSPSLRVQQPAINEHSAPSQALNSPPVPTRSQPPQNQPQFISPAQLIQQPPQAQYMSPREIFQPRVTVSNSSAKMAPIKAAVVPIDRPKLLMSLAEEFFEAAHKLGPSTALSMNMENVEVYQKLVATGLGCLDTALKNVKLPPRMEATIRLRYAGVLYEETENFMEAETALSKGIALCTQNHYFDIRYAMQFLLAQLMFKKSPKAAMKAMDGFIAETTTQKHYSWVYAFRFLRASYSTESGSTTDTNAAAHNLQEVARIASGQRDRAIYLTASLLECMVHLRSSELDSVEQAQTSLAAAWKYQFDTSSQIRQLTTLAHFLDMVCSIKQGNPDAMIKKLKDMQTMIDGSMNDSTWSSNDTIAVPIDGRTSSQVVSPDTRMIIGIGSDGRDNLMIPFLNIKDALAVAHLLAAAVVMHRNSTDHSARKYLQTGLAHIEDSIRARKESPEVLLDCVSKYQWRGQMICYFHIYLAFCAAEVSEWTVMKTHVDKLGATAKTFSVSLDGPLGFFALYLEGVYHQGVGELEAALDIFQDSKFDLSHFQTASLTAVKHIMRDVCLLAALNKTWILQHPDWRDVSTNTNMIAKLKDYFQGHPSGDMQTAFNLVVATVRVDPPAKLHTIKKHLGDALVGAKTTGNTQCICLALNMMCSKFFSGVVGEQAEKSAMAGRMQANKSRNTLWMSVAEGMLAQCYDVSGKKEKAASTWDQARKLAEKAFPSE